ncbi:MAG: OmpW/AlkL family protein [Tenacibaculum sp.]
MITKNKLTQIFCITLMLLATKVYQQKRFKKGNKDLKRFTVKIYNGYTTTNQTSKLLIVGGRYNMSNSITVGFSSAWYYNKNWSAELTASTGKYKIDMINGNYTELGLYRKSMSLGYVWVTPISLSARYHLTEWSKNIIPYVLAGSSYLLFTNVDPGWGASSVKYQNISALHFALGIDFNIDKHWFINAETRKFLTDKSNVEVEILNSQLKTQLKPELFNFTIGVGYIF